MALELYRDKNHACLMFTDLIEEDGQAVQANQFLIVDDGTGAIIDPGGNLAFNELFLAMSKHFAPSKLAYVIASHADPDIIASLDRWMTSTKASRVISRVWERFAPHFTKVGKTENHVFGCGCGNDAPACVAALGAQVQNPVGLGTVGSSQSRCRCAR